MPEKHQHNISQVTAAMLCCTCGACSGVCPVQAIHYQESLGGYYLPVVDDTTCISCGLCMKVCPGIHFGRSLMSTMPSDPFSGKALQAFVGKATDKKIFENAQSGGIVSALLVHALHTGKITGAVTVNMQPGSPPRPVGKIAKTRQEIIGAQKSKYCPVPVLDFLNDLKKHQGPIAVVGTACQIHGLKNCMDTDAGLRNKIAFTIGLVCDRVLTYSALDYLVEKASNQANITSPWNLHFRDKSISGYPGDVHVLSNDGKSVVMPARTRKRIKDSFTPARCRLCFDKMNIFSDITVGDPHGLENIDRMHGESMLITRTEIGRSLAQTATASEAIDIRPVEYAQILEGQGINKKREQWHAYSLAWEELGRELPNYHFKRENIISTVQETSRYQKNLNHSLQLDNFSSRKKLINSVDRPSRKKQVMKVLLTPLRLTKKIAKK